MHEALKEQDAGWGHLKWRKPNGAQGSAVKIHNVSRQLLFYYIFNSDDTPSLLHVE